MNDITTTEDLVSMVKHTLKPYGLVHVDQVLAWLEKQADIARAECMMEELNDRGKEEQIRNEHEGQRVCG